MRRDPALMLETNRFVVVVGRDYGPGGPEAVERRLRYKLREAVADYLIQHRRTPRVLARAAGEAAVRDKLARPGVTVVYLTETHISYYLELAKRLAVAAERRKP